MIGSPVWGLRPIRAFRLTSTSLPSPGKVKAFLARHRRIHVYEFPTAAPELNPTEFVWTQVSAYTANTAPHDMTELRANVRAAVARTRHSPKRLWACIAASELPWKR